MLQLQSNQVTASSGDEHTRVPIPDAAQGHSQDQAGDQDLGQLWGLGRCKDTSAKPPSNAIEPNDIPGSSRHLPLHSSASSYTAVPADLYTVANAKVKENPAGKGGSSTRQTVSGATGASTGISTGECVSRQDSDQERIAAARNLLCSARVNPQDGDVTG